MGREATNLRQIADPDIKAEEGASDCWGASIWGYDLAASVLLSNSCVGNFQELRFAFSDKPCHPPDQDTLTGTPRSTANRRISRWKFEERNSQYARRLVGYDHQDEVQGCSYHCHASDFSVSWSSQAAQARLAQLRQGHFQRNQVSHDSRRGETKTSRLPDACETPAFRPGTLHARFISPAQNRALGSRAQMSTGCSGPVPCIRCRESASSWPGTPLR